MPVDQELPEGENATFLCRFPGAQVVVGWSINGTGRSQFDHLPMGISTGAIIMENGSRVDTLTIQALRKYNGTVIGYLATLLSNVFCLLNATLSIRGM